MRISWCIFHLSPIGNMFLDSDCSDECSRFAVVCFFFISSFKKFCLGRGTFFFYPGRKISKYVSVCCNLKITTIYNVHLTRIQIDKSCTNYIGRQSFDIDLKLPKKLNTHRDSYLNKKSPRIYNVSILYTTKKHSELF